MAKQVTAWADDNGKLHATEADAETANQIIKVITLREKASTVIKSCISTYGGGHGEGPVSYSIELNKLDGCNREFLQPLADYIDLLMKASDERTEKYG